MTKRTAGRVVYFLLHVPKCAGTTVVDHMDRHLGDRSLHAPRWLSPLSNFIGNRYPYTPDSREVREVDVFHGHALSRSLAAHFPDDEIREAVLLRDPVGYSISLYNYRAGRYRDGIGPKDPPFETWYAAERRNPIVRFLLYRYFGWAPWSLWLTSSRGKLRWLDTQLARFWFVGSYRDVNMLVNRVSGELGIPGDPERRNERPVPMVTVDDLSPELVACIRRDNALDNALFERWRDRHFDPDRNPSGPVAEVPGADVLAQMWAELVSGLRKSRIRRAR